MDALIDADMIAYQVGHAASKKWFRVNGWKRKYKYISKAKAFCDKHDLPYSVIERGVEPKGTVEETLEGVENTVRNIVDKCQANEVTLFLTGPTNFRKEVAVSHTYKGNRKDMVLPPHLSQIRQYLIEEMGAIETVGHEADDELGIYQDKEEYSTVICSCDKDLLMIPGYHYNWQKDVTQFVSRIEGLKRFYKQLLTGDKVDNIIGLQGVGPKTADKLIDPLTSEEEMLCLVGHMYATEFDTPEERLLENGQLLWILQERGAMWTIKSF